MAVEVGAARRRIIRRPRLTAMLDEGSARVRLLVAPAGYGKTTLAREWLGEPERRAVWYRGGPASADVAALAIGLAEAASEIVPGAGSRMRDRLRATGHPEEDVDILAELFAQDVQEWPEDAWLVIDDYQFGMYSAASEGFVDRVTQSTPMQLLITSRRRPTWATARRILYGEMLEIDRRALAMNDAEAREVIGREEPNLADLLHIARGWPAVIGLIRLNPETRVVPEALPDQLYDYFGQELYDALPAAEQASLAALAFATHFDRGMAQTLLGDAAISAVDAGMRIGVLAGIEGDSFEIHPLFSQLLQDRAFPSRDERREAARAAGHALIEAARWDDAVELASRFELPGLVVAAIEHALNEFVDGGRTASVRRWVDVAAALHCDSAVLDLAEAELAFRDGDHGRAEGLAAQAAARLDADNELLSRAYIRAGHAALLANREAESIHYFESAETAAGTARERREALLGLYSALSELDRPDAGSALAGLETLVPETPEDIVRSDVITLTQAVRTGGVLEAVAMCEEHVHLLDRVRDPLKRTSFLHVFSNALTVAGRYRQSLEAAEDLNSLADRHRLDFVRPFGLIDRAVACIGLREFSSATRDIASAGRMVADSDVHIEGNLAAIQSRLLVCLGRPREAADAAATVFARGRPTAPLVAEILVVRALAQACASEGQTARETLAKASDVSPGALDVRVLGPAIEAICAPGRSERDALLAEAWREAQTTGNFNALVCAYRGFPDLLGSLSRVIDDDALAALLLAANDLDLARKVGVSIDAAASSGATRLTPRETEVMDLVAAGLSNKEIASTLFISDATVKAHLRHAYEKLGARRRSDAVSRWLMRP